ncbi:hypothetical protein FB451DRAFT_1264470 [Mycena latifolia]|nr:hypothetical protein FB451DRAFT_1264470 [Mycena latifolia]
MLLSSPTLAPCTHHQRIGFDRSAMTKKLGMGNENATLWIFFGRWNTPAVELAVNARSDASFDADPGSFSMGTSFCRCTGVFITGGYGAIFAILPAMIPIDSPIALVCGSRFLAHFPYVFLLSFDTFTMLPRVRLLLTTPDPPTDATTPEEPPVDAHLCNEEDIEHLP